MRRHLPADKKPQNKEVLKMTVQCCVCRKYRVNDSWKKNTKVDERVSHTYCPKCKTEAMKSLLGKKNVAVMAK
jgi:ssDNA-binding Zn-finger/Zn-ribbon topoisomerase 1